MPWIRLPRFGSGQQWLRREHAAGRYFVLPSDLILPSVALRPRATEGVSVVSASRSFGTLAGPVSIRGRPSVVSNAGTTHAVVQAKFCTLTGFSGTIGKTSVKNKGTTHEMVSQAKFCTSAPSGTTGETSGTKQGDDTENPSFKIEIGNAEKLRQRISTELGHTQRKVLDFQSRYTKLVRPLLVSRCLVHPYGLDDPSTVFLHRQTYNIVKHNANYVGCFDIMAHEAGCNDDEWKLFLDHLDKRRIYIIEDWDFAVSTIQTLMYDHGLKEPLDGTGVPFFKGECDGTYDPVSKTANLSYIIWKGDQIIYSEVYKGIQCSSATEAEVFAAMALLHMAIELEIEKLLLCSDCKTVIQILSGEMVIGRNHEHRDFYLMLRSMKAKFNKLIPMWKPRELMVFTDDLAKFTANIELPDYPKIAQKQWEHHLKGFPLFRIRRTKEANEEVKKFDDTELDDSYGENENFVFFVEVEDDYKFDCLVGLKQSLNPSELQVFINDIHLKSDSFRNEFGKVVSLSSQISIGRCRTYKSILPDSPPTNILVVVYDGSIPEDIYHRKGAFHVILVTPHQRKALSDKIPELNALTFVHFKGVTYPLNDPKKVEEWRLRREKMALLQNQKKGKPVKNQKKGKPVKNQKKGTPGNKKEEERDSSEDE